MISLFEKLDNNPIRRAFSGAAMQYDVLTSMHKEIGRDLIKKVREREDCASILDIGMGTGWLTGRLAFYFPETRILGVDFASGMVRAAREQKEGFDIVQADALDLPFRAKSFDLIISNLAYQWVLDLKRSFECCHKILKDDGTLCFTMFGYETLSELFESLQSVRGKAETLPLRRLPRLQETTEALYQAGFKNIESDYERITVHFTDMMAILRWLKGIGANRLQKDFFVGKDLLSKAGEYYLKQFKDPFGVRATFEVFWLKATKT